MTTVFREKEGYPAPAQFSSAAISVPPPAVHGGAGTPAASETPMSGAASKPEAPVADGGGDSIRWAADSRPTNLLWQKIDDRQKNAIFDALNDREDLAGLILFRGAEAGRIEAMDGLDNHLLMHYHKDEFGDANLLRFAPKEGRVVAFETTAADTRAYVARVRPLVDAQRGQGTNAPAPPRYSAPGWLKSLFKRGDR